MSTIIEESTASGLVVPNAVLEQGGIAEGTKVVIESYNQTVVIKPEALSARASFFYGKLAMLPM